MLKESNYTIFTYVLYSILSDTLHTYCRYDGTQRDRNRQRETEKQRNRETKGKLRMKKLFYYNIFY